MLIRYGSELTVSCAVPTPMICMMSAHPERMGDMRQPEVFRVTPEVPHSEYVDMFGNRCRRLIAPPGISTLFSDGVIAHTGLADPVAPYVREVPVAELPDQTLVYLMGSRYCDTDMLSQLAWDRFGGVAPGWGRVQAVCDFVNSHIRFDYMDARSTRTAWQAWQEQRGVCRDFAHLAITICRCLNIPARYVNGQLGDIGVPVTGPMDYAAWMEVYLDHQWWTFDPRNNVRRIGRIVVARGRDAADVPLINSFGPHLLTKFLVWADEVTDTGAQAQVA